ncbi:unnamed protein product [Anisakis simplex]|uniref:Aa_trans domain-containing protein n=1 Tax=Anisakis simplex TaxID=6269 RepID=A0A0M3JCP9_ANISI|nr:unnamed protein product [Anisakis simplex]
MVTVAFLTTSSTVIVAFFHADPRNWMSTEFFKNGYTEMFGGASNFLIAYIGVEVLSYLFEETHAPRKRVPLLLPFIIFIFTLFIFLITMVFSMCLNFQQFSNHVSILSDVFLYVQIPSAR